MELLHDTEADVVGDEEVQPRELQPLRRRLELWAPAFDGTRIAVALEPRTASVHEGLRRSLAATCIAGWSH